MKMSIKDIVPWIFRSFVILALILMVISFITPWWSITIYVPTYEGMPSKPGTIQIYAYGLRHDLVELRSYVEADETPVLQQSLAWAYLGTSFVLGFASIWLNKRLGSFLMGLVGLSYLVYVLIAIFVIVRNRMAEFGANLTGLSSATYNEGAEVNVGFEAASQQGFYLAIIAGVVLLVLAACAMLLTINNKDNQGLL